MNIREDVKDRMIEKGWNAGKLADKAKVSRSTVYEYIAGKHDIQTNTLESMLIVLGFKLVTRGE